MSEISKQVLRDTVGRSTTWEVTLAREVEALELKVKQLQTAMSGPVDLPDPRDHPVWQMVYAASFVAEVEQYPATSEYVFHCAKQAILLADAAVATLADALEKKEEK